MMIATVEPDTVKIIQKQTPRSLYDQSYNWLTQHGPGIILGIVILFVGLWAISLLSKWLHRGMQKRNIDASLKPFLLSLTITSLRILLVLGVMQIVGIEMTMFATIIGGMTVALGLALSGTLQNFASGVLILLLKPFRVGDNIVAQGQEGTVTAIQLFFTIVTTYDNRTVIVPNSKLSNEIIINISHVGSRRLDIELKFGYGMDFEQIKTILNKAIDDSKDCLKSPERSIGISSLESDGYKVQVNVWVAAHGFKDSKLKLQEAIMRDLKGAGIKLPGMT
jgi:small conductance mechanosensitive channel